MDPVERPSEGVRREHGRHGKEVLIDPSVGGPLDSSELAGQEESSEPLKEASGDELRLPDESRKLVLYQTTSRSF